MFTKRRILPNASLVIKPLILALLATPTQAHPIKLTTWNLNWLTQRPPNDPALPQTAPHRSNADIQRLRDYATKLDADIVALEEVDGPSTAALLFPPPDYTLLSIHQDVVQQVILAIRRPLTATQNPDLAALDTEPPTAPHRLRHGLDATITLGPNQTLRLLAIHLKTGCHTESLAPPASQACALLAAQIPPLAAWLHARAEEGVPFAILGDFNRVLDAPEPLGTALTSAAPLLRANAGMSNPCWQGSSFIDHIILGNSARFWLQPGSLRVLTYQGASPEDAERLSDHCPLSIRLEPR